MASGNNNDPLYSFGQVLQQQFSLGSNDMTSLNLTTNGVTQRYGQLGAFASQFDQSAERSYTEEGSFSVDAFNPKPKQLDILMQDPDITVLIKKRAFSSLSENYRQDLMDLRETLFIRATKILFQNKCNQIANFERLTKLAKVTTDVGRLDEYLLPILFNLVDSLNGISGILGGVAAGALGGLSNIVNQVRTVVNLSSDSDNTNWITNLQNSFQSTFAQGTGVIEFNNVISLSTTLAVKPLGAGKFSLSLSDPYEMMLITNADIDQAVADLSNSSYNSDFFQLGVSSLSDTISLNKQLLTANRNARGASPIEFMVQPDTFIGQRVIAVVEAVGQQLVFSGSILGVNLDPSALQGSAQLGDQGLNPNEANLFKQIVQQYFTQISINANSQTKLTSFNKDPNITSVRKKLRLHYANKLVIQPMDNVHIYIRSNKKIDNKIVGGLQSSFTGASFLQSAQDLVGNLTDAFSMSSTYPLEKTIFLGDPNFPNWLWMIFRSWFMSEKDGAHVFGGIVDEATSSFGNGAFHVSVSGSDNAGYFKYGVVNIKPSVDVYNGSLYDPLTPFDIQFDSVTGVQKEVTPPLLPENSQLFTSVFLKNKNGPDAGIVPDAQTYLTTDAERQKNTDVRRVFYDPDGMVYRWKEGIGSLVLFGDSYEENPVDPRAVPALTEDPFAGQDIMNVLSLLITGEPYNYATYYKAASQFDTFGRDSVTGSDPAFSYFRSLQTSLKYRNLLYGNFVPFKSLVVDEATYAKILGNVLNAQAFDSQLAQLLQQRATAADKLVVLTNSQQGQSAGGLDPAASQTAQQYLSDLDTQIQQKINNITTELNKVNKPISILGDDISFDSSTSINPGSPTRLDNTSREQLRKKLQFLKRRLSWKVRANSDVNFLVVDDLYDKDYDIQAFEKSFTNPTLFKSEYVTVADKISSVASKLDFEVFSNTQGHIEIRNPKYNYMPSSVFYKMFRRNDDLGIKVFPQFIEDLYVNQIQSSLQQIETLEDEIRLYCLALGDVTDAKCQDRINGMGQSNIANSVSSSNISSFYFLSGESTGTIAGNFNITQMSIQSNPDQVLSGIQALETQVQIQTRVNAFDIGTRANIIQSNIPSPTSNNPSQFNNLTQILSQQSTITRENQIIQRLQQRTGQTFDFSSIQPKSIALNTVSSMDILNITNQISSRLLQRQNAVKAAVKALENVKESIELAQDGTGSNRNIIPSLYTSNTIPQVFKFLIEDESYDDLGPGSGSRYVIKNHDIINYSISERRPPYTAVEVTGSFGDLFIQNSQLPQDLNVFQNGNALTTAAAVDYDLWRMYGIALPQAVSAPFLLDPGTQAPIYAVSLLNRAKKQILSGSVTIVGNEYQQPGEVIYLENRDLLFYIESITHNFEYGKSFTTSMNIEYGHNPGEFIPSPLDIFGKLLYNNKDITTFAHKRQGNVFNQEHVGTIVGNFQSQGNPDSDIVNGPYGDANKSTLQKIIDYASSALALSSDNFQPMLEIRTFYNSGSSFSGPNSYATNLANSIQNYLLGTNSLTGNANASLNPSSNPPAALSAFSSQISVLAVDSFGKTGSYRYPSGAAYFYGRDMAKQTSVSLVSSTPSNPNQQQIDNMIYSFVVDCWIVFNNPNNKSSI